MAETKLAVLVAPSQDKLREELGLIDPNKLSMNLEDDPKLLALADSYVEQLVSVSPEDFKKQAAGRDAVENMGMSLVQESARRSELLREPIRALTKPGVGSGDVANVLVQLKLEVEKHDPNKWDFGPGWFSRLVGRAPVLGDKIKEYFTQFEEARTVIDAIARSLKNGRDELKRDCVILREDQIAMREVTLKLQKVIKLAMLIDKRLEAKLSTVAQGDEKRIFIEQELLFPIRQRVNGLQTQLGFSQIGVLAYETIVRTNLELVRGIDLTLNTTVSGLTVATVLSLALAHQKNQLDKVLAVNKATAKLLVETTEKLKTQGVEVQKMASSPMIAVEVMKTAFANIQSAFDEISRFRKEALPNMAKNILELDDVTDQMEKLTQDMERGNRTIPSLELKVD